LRIFYQPKSDSCMAKNKKSAAKKAAKPKAAAKAKPVAKKAAPKAKPVEKKAPAKKAAPAKAKPVAKKAAAPAKAKAVEKPAEKVVEKKVEKVVAKKPAAPATAPVKKAAAPKAATPAPPKPEAPAPRPLSSQLNFFQMPNQRPVAHKPAKPSSTPDDKTRYSEEELKEFEALIIKKLDKAKEEYRILKDTLNRNNDEGTDATSGGNTKVLEDGAETAEKENLSQLAARQQKYITNLENALVRIKNGTYGICSVTGKLISKERLIAVPHTTQSIEAKLMQQD
jgi:RNA polymerase-binding transcription factor DksA